MKPLLTRLLLLILFVTKISLVTSFLPKSRFLSFHRKKHSINTAFDTEYAARTIAERTNFQLQEFYWVTPIGLNMEVLISEADQTNSIDGNLRQNRVNIGRKIIDWFKRGNKIKTNTEKETKLKPPILFIHGSFHSAWCFAEHFMPYFTKFGHDCYSVSLRGTAATGMPPNDPGESVKIQEHVQDLSYCLDTIISRYEEKGAAIEAPIIVGHSAGGLMALKMLELEKIRRRVSGVVLLCSVPPSGNVAMIKRFFQRNLCQVIRIVWGLVFKKATTSLSVCRDIFFDQTVPEKDLNLYMKRFQIDSRVGLDLNDLSKVLPSITCLEPDGRASWLKNLPGVNITIPSTSYLQRSPLDEGMLIDDRRIGEPQEFDRYGNHIPARLVIGAEKDYIVDLQGVQETAKYLNIGEGPILVPELYHDVMLGPKWKRTARVMKQWIDTAVLKERSGNNTFN